MRAPLYPRVLFLGALALTAACATGTLADEALDLQNENGTGTDSDAGSSHVTTGNTHDAATPPNPVDASPGNLPDSSDSIPPTDDAGADSGSASTPPPPACTTTPPSNTCGLVPQCGCSATQTCDVTNKTTGDVTCVSAGSSAQGDACTSTSQCAVGLTCANGACRPYCPTAGTACSGSGLGDCLQLKNGSKSIPNDTVCTVTCDLLDPSAACGSNNCVWDFADGVSDCETAGSGGVFHSCSTDSDCGPGFVCADDGEYVSCLPWCQRTSDCPSGLKCYDVFGADAPTQGGTAFGACDTF